MTGIGGIFIKANNPSELQKWYQENFGLPADEDNPVIFQWQEADAPEQLGQTVWSLFPRGTTCFDPSRSSCLRGWSTTALGIWVENLERMLAQLREARVTVIGGMVEEHGSFAWVLDPEGNKIELWETPKTA